ncbi:MAG TPA: Crp/Fnr family transcriptional regulator [Usitatibacter sp.]|nr:Crp/Fnr family transcriptional regulator [Usitatibacter sp.]
MAEIGNSRPCVQCSACSMYTLCNPREAPVDFQSPVECRRRIARGEAVYGTQAPRSSLFALRAGSLKATLPDAKGGTHILRFLFAGDAAGLHALNGDTAPVELSAMEDSEVCVIPAYRAQVRATYSTAIAHRLWSLLSAELAQAQAHATMLARLDAAARVAQFLIDHARGSAGRNAPGTVLPLPMSRRELGEHLNLTMESTSRILSDFQARGLVRLTRGGVELLQEDALAQQARGEAVPA